MGYFVPETLQKLPQWLVWRLEYQNKGKASKVPYNAKTGYKASPTNSKHWTSYEEAITAFEFGDFNGIGFVLSPEDNLVFIDIDNCIIDGELNPFAEEILAMFPDTYAEISQSETGLHIICKGQICKAIKRKEIEIYSEGRYLAFTGNAISPTEPQSAQGALNILLSKYAVTEPPEAPKTAYSKSRLTAEEIIYKVCNGKDSAKYTLLHNGEWEKAVAVNGLPYSSRSEAELAYIARVNYFANGDEELIRQVWASSKLSERSKGKRIDYLLRTIKAAKRTATGSKTLSIVNRSGITDQIKNKRKRAF